MLIVTVALLSAAGRGLTATRTGGLESVPFRFYEQLADGPQTREQCRTDVNGMLDGAKNLDKWALESWWFLFNNCISRITVYVKYIVCVRGAVVMFWVYASISRYITGGGASYIPPADQQCDHKILNKLRDISFLYFNSL